MQPSRPFVLHGGQRRWGRLLRLQEGSLRGHRLGVVRTPTTLTRGQSMDVIYRE